MESASEKRVIDNNDPEGQQLYYEKIEKEHKDINELFEHCVSGDYDPVCHFIFSFFLYSILLCVVFTWLYFLLIFPQLIFL